jgi:hypothetical protein
MRSQCRMIAAGEPARRHCAAQGGPATAAVSLPNNLQACLQPQLSSSRPELFDPDAPALTDMALTAACFPWHLP